MKNYNKLFKGSLDSISNFKLIGTTKTNTGKMSGITKATNAVKMGGTSKPDYDDAELEKRILLRDKAKKQNKKVIYYGEKVYFREELGEYGGSNPKKWPNLDLEVLTALLRNDYLQSGLRKNVESKTDFDYDKKTIIAPFSQIVKNSKDLNKDQWRKSILILENNLKESAEKLINTIVNESLNPLPISNELYETLIYYAQNRKGLCIVKSNGQEIIKFLSQRSVKLKSIYEEYIESKSNAGRPRKHTHGEFIKKTFIITPVIEKALKKKAKESNVQLNELVRDIITKALCIEIMELETHTEEE